MRYNNTIVFTIFNPHFLPNYMFLVALCFTFLKGQPEVEYLGLGDKPITALGIYGNVIAIGTNSEGVFYQYISLLPDSGWVNIGLEGENVRTVYPHKSGPLGWGLTVGVFPAAGDSDYVYCSFMGDDFILNSTGISDSLTTGIYRLAGFPDPTICGEKYAAAGRTLYRQGFTDSLWVPVYESLGIEGEGVIFVKTRENVGGFVLAGGSEGFTGILLIKSNDFGETWDYLYPPGPVVAFDFDVDSAYTDFQTIFVSHGTQISRSLDGGDSWEIVLGYMYSYFTEVLFDEYTTTIFVGGEEGHLASTVILAYSNDLGNTWNHIQLSMSGPINGMALGSDDFLYFAAPYSGVFRLSVTDLSIDSEPIPQSFTLYQNYPNPFNPITTIRYELPERTPVRLTIYDLLGREVTVLINGEYPAGFYEAQWDASSSASGIHFYRLTASPKDLSDNFDPGYSSITKKLLIIR